MPKDSCLLLATVTELVLVQMKELATNKLTAPVSYKLGSTEGSADVFFFDLTHQASCSLHKQDRMGDTWKRYPRNAFGLWLDFTVSKLVAEKFLCLALQPY